METLNFILNTIFTIAAFISFAAWFIFWYFNGNSTQEVKSTSMKHILEAFFAWAFSIIVPVLFFLKIAIGVVLADFVIGFVAAMWLKEGFNTRKFLFTIVQFVCYCVAIATVYHIEVFMQIPPITIGTFNITVAGFLTGIIAVKKLASIDDNWKKLFNWSFMDLLKQRFSTLKEFDSPTQ